jgi:hypothetical protein
MHQRHNEYNAERVARGEPELLVVSHTNANSFHSLLVCCCCDPFGIWLMLLAIHSFNQSSVVTIAQV